MQVKDIWIAFFVCGSFFAWKIIIDILKNFPEKLYNENEQLKAENDSLRERIAEFEERAKNEK